MKGFLGVICGVFMVHDGRGKSKRKCLMRSCKVKDIFKKRYS